MAATQSVAANGEKRQNSTKNNQNSDDIGLNRWHLFWNNPALFWNNPALFWNNPALFNTLLGDRSQKDGIRDKVTHLRVILA